MDLVGILTLVTVGLAGFFLIVLVFFILETLSLDEGCGCILFIGGIFFILPQISPLIVSIRRFWTSIISGITSFTTNTTNFITSFLPLIIFIAILISIFIFLLLRLLRRYENLGTLHHKKDYSSQEKAKIGSDGELINDLNLVEIIKGKGTQVSEKIFLESGIYSLSCKIKQTTPISVTVLTTRGKAEIIEIFNFRASSAYPLVIEISDNYVFAIKTSNDVLTKWELQIRQR